MDKIKILWELQLSSIDKTTGKFLQSDSNITFLLGFEKGCKSFAEITPICPKDVSEFLSGYFDNIFIQQFEDPHLSRFKFNPSDWYDILKSDFDVVFLNDPCHVAPVKLLLKRLNKSVPIITCNHWIDFEKNRFDPPLFYRQIEGQSLADLVVVDSIAAKELVLQQFKAIGSIDVRVEVLYPPAFAPSFDEVKRAKNIELPTENLLLYNNRLSSIPEYSRALERLIECCNILNRKGLEINCVFTNPSGYPKVVEESIARRLKQNAIFVRWNYWQYYNALYKFQFLAAAFFDVPRIWSIALSDAACLGNAVIAPNHSCFKEMFNDEHLFNNVNEAADLIYDAFTDEERFEKLKARDFGVRFSPYIIGKKFKMLLEDLLSKGGC